MGTIKTGILGGFNGTVGTVVGSNWKGISTMRAKPKGRKGTFSTSQLDQQARFALMMKFLQPLSDFMNMTYKKAAIKMSGFNKVFSQNLQNAISGVYPAPPVNDPEADLSRGNLPNVNNAAAASTATGKLVFTWADNTGDNGLA